MNDDWMSEVLHRVDEREARERGEREADAASSPSIFWPTFFAVALGVPVGLWLYNLDLGALAGPMWQTVVGLLGG